MESLEAQKKKLEKEMNTIQEQLLDIEKIRNSTYLLAKSYENKLSLYDTRLQHIISHLDTNNNNNNGQEYQYKVIGKTISELRLIKQNMNNDMDKILKEKGLKVISPSYKFYNGESVIIIKQNDVLEGVMANIVIDDNDEVILKDDEVRIIPSFQWQPDDDIMNNDYNNDNNPTIVKRKDLAIWDYNDDYYDDSYSSSSSSERKQKQDKLFQALKQIKTTTTTSEHNNNRKIQSAMRTNNNYISARERKAAMKSNKKKKKK